ncbi:MAG: ABC transporter ATP-binding protein [Pseudomonadota bacterium]
MAVLEVENLTVALPASADRAHAVEDVALQVGAGEILCVVGESGSGKSVTAFSVMGLADRRALTPVGGAIRLDGEDILNADTARMRRLRGEKMAMIFQEPMTALNPVMRVGDQIGEMLEIHTDFSTAARKDRVLAAMGDVNLPEPEQMFGAYPHQLSGGQRQRIMIAMALVLEPKLLIADEPTTALDVTTQAQILALIKDIQTRKGMAVMFITHDFGVVAEIATRVAVMKEGCIVEQGTTAKVLGAPRDPYTKMLIAAVPSMDPPERSPSTGDVALATDDLVKTYGAPGVLGTGRVVKAVQQVDLTVRRGETLGIVGESGSGKSTVARCVMRLIDPTSGEVLINGENIAGLSEGQLRPHRRDIQIVFQDPYRSLNPRRTVGQSIVEGPVNFGLAPAAAQERASDLMRVVGLSPEALERFPHQFSGGQRQRICIARALAMEPQVLIADEAVSALDVSVQAQVLNLLDDVRRRFDLAMLFITHDLRVAAQICDRIMVMNRGEVVETGPTAQVYADPKHAYTRALLAAAPGQNAPEAAAR